MTPNLKQALSDLKGLYEDGLIDEAEYRKEKDALLSSARSGSIPGANATRSGTTSPGSRRNVGTTLAIDDDITPFFPGATLGAEDRPYRLGKRLGAGGMGQVWQAMDLKDSEALGRDVWKAVKILAVSAEADPVQYKALKQEAMLAEQLRHHHIVSVFGWREDPITGIPFIVMEWLQGKDLGTLLAEEGDPGLPFERVVQLLDPVIEALDYAWTKHQLVHRDIKPANVYLTEAGEIKLLDFGIAARIGKTASSIGLKGREQAGTPGYRPPEARARRKPAPSWDVYGLGALTYELLTGTPPFDEDRAPYTPAPDAPEALTPAQWEVLQHAFAFDETQRIAGVKAYWQALQKARGPTAEEIERQRQEEAAKATEAARLQAEAQAAAEARRKADEAARLKAEAEVEAWNKAEAEARQRAAEQARREAEERVRKETKDKLDEKEEQELWEHATSLNSVSSYENYLAKSRRHDFRPSALKRILELKETTKQESAAKQGTHEAARRKAQSSDHAQDMLAKVTGMPPHEIRQGTMAMGDTDSKASAGKFARGLLVGFVLVVAALIVANLSSTKGESEITKASTLRNLGDSCRQDSDCAGRFRCNSGICGEPGSPITTQSQTAAPLNSDRPSIPAESRAIGQSCRSNADCLGSSNCVSGTCQAAQLGSSSQMSSASYSPASRSHGQSCNSNSDCIGSLFCRSGRCGEADAHTRPSFLTNSRNFGESCTLDSECVGRFRCNSGLCGEPGGRISYPNDSRNFGESCQQDSECIGRFRCNSGLCGEPGQQQVRQADWNARQRGQACKLNIECAGALDCTRGTCQ